MSADNWGKCPKCKVIASGHQMKLKADAQAAYGKISADEYLELLGKVQNQPKPQDTLREDYETRIDEDGKFSVSYSAICQKCALTFTFYHSEDVLFSVEE